ncbi:tetratricopeptide repeat protein [candidate division KSB1 bacterium]|nr:tetratricopeptide repeat protein [candidate division KSB1 bacterium]
MEKWMIYVIIGVAVLLLLFFFIVLQRRSRRRLGGSPYTEALNAIINGDEDRALLKLKETVRQDTTNVDAYIKMGNLLRKHGEVARAIKIHRDLTARDDLTPFQQVEIYKGLILDFQAADDPERAIKYVDKLLDMDKRNEWAWQEKLKIYEKSGQWAKAFDTTKKILGRKKEKGPRLLALYKVEEGLFEMAKGQEKEGRIRLREALKIDYTCPPAYLHRGESYFREGRREDAIKEWEKFVKVNPRLSHLVFKRLEENLYEEGKFGQIEELYQGVIDSHPQNARAVIALANFYERKGETETAIEILEKGLEASPGDIPLQRNLIRCYYKQGNTEKVVSLGMEVVESFIEEKESYHCGQCGFTTDEPAWHCRKCGAWDSFLGEVGS